MPGTDVTRPTPHASRPARPAAVALATALAAGVLVTAGCGSGGTPPPATPSTSDIDLGVVEEGVHNRQDAAFVRDMIVHHRQSIQLARLAKDRTRNEQVLTLAGRIEAAQTPEIAQLSRWLTEWKQPDPSPSGTAASAIPGMAAARDVQALTSARDGDFDRRFLTLMIAHHTGAVTQARDQLKNGADERVKGLASDIAAAQETEIAEMRKLLG